MLTYFIIEVHTDTASPAIHAERVKRVRQLIDHEGNGLSWSDWSVTGELTQEQLTQIRDSLLYLDPEVENPNDEVIAILNEAGARSIGTSKIQVKLTGVSADLPPGRYAVIIDGTELTSDGSLEVTAEFLGDANAGH